MTFYCSAINSPLSFPPFRALRGPKCEMKLNFSNAIALAFSLRLSVAAAANDSARKRECRERGEQVHVGIAEYDFDSIADESVASLGTYRHLQRPMHCTRRLLRTRSFHCSVFNSYPSLSKRPLSSDLFLCTVCLLRKRRNCLSHFSTAGKILLFCAIRFSRNFMGISSLTENYRRTATQAHETVEKRKTFCSNVFSNAPGNELYHD